MSNAIHAGDYVIVRDGSVTPTVRVLGFGLGSVFFYQEPSGKLCSAPLSAVERVLIRGREVTPRIRWVKPLEPCGGSWARLHGSVEILGVPFHVNAEQVTTSDTPDGDGQQQLSVDNDTYVSDIQELCQGPGQTVIIAGKTYLLLISPYAE